VDRSKFTNKHELRTFGFVLSVLLGLVATVLLAKHKSAYQYIYPAGIVICFVSLVIPMWIKPIYIVFSYFGQGMGWVMTRVILFVIYYLVFTPIGLLGKLARKKFLDMDFRRSSSASTYWHEVPPVLNAAEEVKSYENQF